MSNRENPLYWAFPVGTWFGVRVRVSWLMPLAAAGLMFEFGWRYGGVLFAILMITTLLHEFGHILAARAMDGSGDEILLWPLGGLAFVERSASPKTQFVVASGGPLVNAALCVLCVPAVLASPYGAQVLHPLLLPIAREDFGRAGLLADVQVLTFCVNWMLLLVNLIPAFPLDGGRMAWAWLAARFNAATASEISVRVAYGVAFLLVVVGLFFFKSVVLLSIAFLIVVLAMQESIELRSGEAFDDSFMGYDFSQGYTSLERAEKTRPAPRPGLLARWLEMRRAEKQRRAELQQQEAEKQLDSILAKVHERGLEALSPSERRTLDRASDRFRSRGNDQR